MSAETNPYSSPQAPGDPSMRPPEASRGVQIVAGIVSVVGFTLLFAVVGGLLAAGLNRLVPGYCSGVLVRSSRELLVSTSIVALGIAQGLQLGFGVGVVVVGGLGWFRQLHLARSLHALWIIAAVALGFAAAGMLIGFGIGALAPEYYRGVFDSQGLQADFRPLDVGLGLGCTEGLMLGAVAGTLVVVALAWRRSRRTRGIAPL